MLGLNEATPLRVQSGDHEGSRDMFDNAIYNSLKKRVDPYLEPGEDLLSVTMTEAEGNTPTL